MPAHVTLVPTSIKELMAPAASWMDAEHIAREAAFKEHWGVVGKGDKQWSTRRRANNEWRSRQRHLRRVVRSRGAAGRAGARDDDSISLGHGPGTGSSGGPGGGWPSSNEGAGSGHVDLYRALASQRSRARVTCLIHALCPASTVGLATLP